MSVGEIGDSLPVVQWTDVTSSRLADADYLGIEVKTNYPLDFPQKKSNFVSFSDRVRREDGDWHQLRPGGGGGGTGPVGEETRIGFF